MYATACSPPWPQITADSFTNDQPYIHMYFQIQPASNSTTYLAPAAWLCFVDFSSA